ncbi:caspase recruitment domain-containing protein 19 isoform X3 [Elephas maximus indicus]|uniref:caspase recruitment domain-containing protein 19 isoform X3 n=1 Tax=Elephas maximus indicus TaxID=99487 RepID=UPI002115E85A|nr:caspase recruitment domain-containing protein 19 isoform X3 [Elephas maximus indicus]
MTDQTYCDRLVQDTPFLTGHGRLSEQQVDKIILQLNRYYPQILTNKEAEKASMSSLGAGFRNPKAALRMRLCNLLSHLQQSGERDCQEFYRALYIHAQPLYSCLPSRHALRPLGFLACLSVAVGLALLMYCCPPGGSLQVASRHTRGSQSCTHRPAEDTNPKVLPGARRVLGFSPVIIERHISRYLLTFLAEDLGGP